MAEARVSRALATSVMSMPAEAIPGVIDALFSATEVRSSVVFQQLLGIYEAECQELLSNHQFFLAFKSTMLHLLRNSDSSVEDLDVMVRVVCLPLLRTSSAKASKLFAEAVAAKRSWNYASESLIPSCYASMNFHMDGKSFNNSNVALTLPAACHIVSELLVVAIADASEGFCGNLVNQFWDPCLRLLSGSLDESIRNLALQTLLPSLLKAIQFMKLKSANRLRNLNDVWTCCKVLFSSGVSQRRDAFNILTMLADFLNDTELVLQEPELWKELRAGLVDEDSLTRKRALHVLKNALNLTERQVSRIPATTIKLDGTKRERWAEEEAKSLGVKSCKLELMPLTGYQQWTTFFLLYDILDEYGIHLVEAAWKNQITALTRSTASVLQSDKNLLGVDFSWITVLFKRGFSHGNPQVRRHVVQSFFEMEWELFCSSVPEEFVRGPLVHALNDPVHHKDFGVNNVYTSETGKLAARFFQAYSQTLDLNARACFIISLCNTMSEQLMCRSGLMTIASCIEAVASGCPEGNVVNAAEGERLLDAVRKMVEISKHHFNRCYRTQVCYHVLKTVCSLVSFTTLNFDKLSYFLTSFPRDFLGPAGPARSTFESWRGAQAEDSIFEGLQTELVEFLKAPDSKESVYVFTEGDVQCWREKADRWARILFIALTGEQHQSELLLLLEQYAVEIYDRAYMPLTVPEKVLLLIQSISIEWSVLEAEDSSFFGSRLSKLFDTILGELMSYAERSVMALWEYELDCPMHLPPSLAGRLGGPSQRWLSSQAASVAVKAVLAVETVSKCYSWFSENLALQESVGTRLWKLSWELLTVYNEQEMVRAEFQLAGFEALAFICKTLPRAYTYTMITEGSSFMDLKPDVIVDSLVRKLLKVFDGIMHEGKLARSRRAVLTRHKWSCLAELLSLCKIQSGGESDGQTSAISISTLSIVLQDAMDSLGSAAEDYIVPLFKCLRLLIQQGVLNAPENMNQVVWELVRSGWACMADCNKRKVAVLATFLSSFFHPRLFSLLDMHNGGDDEVGPLKWLLGRLIELGARSPRTMRLTALHVTGLWLKFPETTVFYMSEIKSMCLYGGEAIDEEFEGEIFDNELGAREYAALIQSSDPELQEAYANTDMFVRVAVAVMIDKLAEIVDKGPADDYESRITVPAAANCGRILLLHLLQAAANDTDLTKELYKKNSVIHRRKVRVWQTLCILSRFVHHSALDEITTLLKQCLYMNNMPSVRQYIEIFAVQLYLRFPDLIKNHLVSLLSDVNMKTQALSSYVHIASNVMNFVSPMLQERVVEDLLPVVVPHMTSHHHNLRTFSQVLIFKALRIYLNAPSLSEKLGPRCLRAISSYLDENADCTRLRSSVDQFLFKLEPTAASTPRGIFCFKDDATKVGDRPFECVPIAVMDKVSELLNETREELRESMAADGLYLNFGGEKRSKAQQEGHSDYQKKISPYKDKDVTTLKDIEHEDDLLFSFIENKGREVARAFQGRQDLIMVASLIERIPNLAGLARTCEVFKASGLAVADRNILEDRQFKLISVTAEQWVPILEVAEAGLNHFLELKKTQGYTILGLEQTANSVAINQYPFPPKVVLVLGREKDGIPVNIIQTLDACVEIPQLGMIRSLNVHVSGAIALWEYTKQRLSS